MHHSEQQLYRRYLDQAWALHMAGQPEAVPVLEKGVALFTPEDGRLVYFWERAGQIYEGAGLGSSAADAYRKVLAQEPDNNVATAGLQRLSEQENDNGE